MNLNKIFCFLFFGIGISFSYCQKIEAPLRKYVKTITSDFSTGSYYVCIKIEIKNNFDTIVITNNELYHLFRKNTNCTFSYKSKVKRILLKNKSIKLRDKFNENISEYIFNNDTSVNMWAEKGKDEFIDHYFTEGYQKTDLSDSERKSIIYQLFKWQILVSNNCESGEIVVDEYLNKFIEEQ